MMLNCRSVLALATLVVAATAVADTVVTTEEVIPCSVIYADSDFVRVRLPEGGIRAMSTYDVRELRLSDSARVAEFAGVLGLLAERDNGRCLSPIARNASLVEMVRRCEELGTRLHDLDCGDDAIIGLLRAVEHEAKLLRAGPPPAELLSAPCGTLSGMLIGALLGGAVAPPNWSLSGEWTDGGVFKGCGVGGVLGLVAGVDGGIASRAEFLSSHRRRVSDLTGRFNRIVVFMPDSTGRSES